MTDYMGDSSVGLAGGPSSQFPTEQIRPQVRLRPHGTLGDAAGTVTVQGEVTGNFNVDRTLPRLRTKNSEKAAEQAPMEIFGGNMDDLQIKQHDLLFAQKNPNRMVVRGRNAPPKVSTTYAMSSMTGISTKHREVYNQEDWEDLFWVPGRAKTNWNHGDSSQGQPDVAVQMRGSMTVRNNGMDTFTMGDYVAWRSYSIDPDTRREEKRRVRKAHGEPLGKLGVLLRRVSFEDIHRLPSSALSRYVKNFRASQERSSFLRSGYTQPLGDARLESKERFFLSSMRAECTIGFIINLAVAQRAGLVTINLSGSSVTDEALLNSVRELRMADLERSDYEVSGGGLQKSVDPELRDRRWKQLTLLARAYGCYAEHSGKPVPHLDNVVDAAILSSNAGLLDRPETYELSKSVMLSKMARKPGTMAMPGSMSAANSAESKLDNLQRDYATMKYQSYSEAEHHARKNVLGICTRGAEAGEQMDLLI